MLFPFLNRRGHKVLDGSPQSIVLWEPNGDRIHGPLKLREVFLLVKPQDFAVLAQVVAHFLPAVNKGKDPPIFNELLAFTRERWPDLKTRDRVNVSAQALRELMVPYKTRKVRS
jgi:hypothetical protein